MKALKITSICAVVAAIVMSPTVISPTIAHAQSSLPLPDINDKLAILSNGDSGNYTINLNWIEGITPKYNLGIESLPIPNLEDYEPLKDYYSKRRPRFNFETGKLILHF